MTQAIGYDGPSKDRGAAQARAQLQGLLISGETVTACALQHRLYAFLHRRHLAAATSGRFIFLSRPLLGGYTPFAVRWQDLKEVKIAVGLFTASVTISYSANLSDTAEDSGAFQSFRAGGLIKAQAEALYRECQGQEQSWREKRRVRSMEEMRAKSGAVQIATGVYPSAGRDPALDYAPSAPAGESPAQRLSRAREMLAEGLITDSEYEAIKARIVGSL